MLAVWAEMTPSSFVITARFLVALELSRTTNHEPLPEEGLVVQFTVCCPLA